MPKGIKNRTEHERECLQAYQEFKGKDHVIGGLDVSGSIPELPKAESVPNYGVPYDSRVFTPIKLPDVIEEKDEKGNILNIRFDCSPQQEEDLLNLIYQYRTEGYFFYSGNDLRYITGDHWYYLNFCKIKVKDKQKDSLGRRRKTRALPTFTDSDLNWFLFWKTCELHTFCFGMVYLSSRRSGKTYKSSASFLNQITMLEETVYGIQAQTEKIAKKIFLEFIQLWKHLPKHPWLFPVHKGDMSPTNSLEFVSPKATSRKTMFIKERKALNNSIDYEASTASAYDGRDLWRELVDEACKMENCDINELVSTMKETMGDGAEAIGKMIITSTAENLGGKTLPQFLELWKSSTLKELNAFGSTASGFFRFFQSAAIGYRYDVEDGKLPKEFQNLATIDKFGNSNIENATKIIKELRRNKKGLDLIRFTRKFPLSEEEAFANTDTLTPFDVEKITEHQEHNMRLEERGELGRVRGDFVWTEYFRKVMFIPRPEGRFLVSWHPKPEDQNKFIWSGSGIAPAMRDLYIGFDPFSHKHHEDDRKFSNAAVNVIHMGGAESHPHLGTVCDYCCRVKDPNEQYDDVMKMAIYYSAPVIIENIKGAFIDWADFNGFSAYVERNPINLMQKNAGVSTRGDATRDAMIGGVMAFVVQHLGRKIAIDAFGDEYEYYEHFPFNEILEDLKQFNPNKWGKYDRTVAFMLALLAKKKEMYAGSMPTWNAEDWGMESEDSGDDSDYNLYD